MSPTSYLRIYLGCLSLLLVLMAGFNFLVDPYDINSAFKRQAINGIKPEIASHIRLSKAYRTVNSPPVAIVLGSSRALTIDTAHSDWSNPEPRLNLALDGVNMFEVLQYFKHASQQGKLQHAIIGLDFFYFNIYWASGDQSGNAVFLEGNDPFKKAAVYAQLPVLLSFDTVSNSIATIRSNNEIPSPKNNLPRISANDSASIPQIREKFLRSETQYIKELYFPAPLKRYAFDNNAGQSSLNEFRELIRLAKKKNIDLDLYISPSHARQWELIRAAGLWPLFETWKRALVNILEEEYPRSPEKNEYRLWDFSGYTSITTEALPNTSGSSHDMKYYRDSSHFSPETARLVLNRIFAEKSRKFDFPADFGVAINKNNIDSHLAAIRKQQTQYQVTHPDEILEIETLVASLKGKQSDHAHLSVKLPASLTTSPH